MVDIVVQVLFTVVVIVYLCLPPKGLSEEDVTRILKDHGIDL